MNVTDKYAAFIITFKRPEILRDTLKALLAQTAPPGNILIVDNDPDASAKKIAEGFNGIAYHNMGYNSGPAGAAAYGLRKLFTEDWQWVLWMDDNDPPQFENVIENILKIPSTYSHPELIGMIGAVGVRFNKWSVKTIRIPDQQLKGLIEVDNVAGNMLPMIHRRVFEKNVFPDESLFFGFEELDFSLAIKRAGLKVIVSGEEVHRHREKAGRLNFKRKTYQEKDIKKLWREFYSVRNITFILKNKEKNIPAVFVLLMRISLKSLAGYKWGFNYGCLNMKYLFTGFIHGISGKLGQRQFS